ncbi:hypothetical protein ES703_41721 [subsurface metagenome]|nr:hypothetical protein [bacterium]
MKREIVICDTCGKAIREGCDGIGSKHINGKDYHAGCIPLEPAFAFEHLALAILEDEPRINTSGNMGHYDFLQGIKDQGHLSQKALWAVNYLQTRHPRRKT